MDLFSENYADLYTNSLPTNGTNMPFIGVQLRSLKQKFLSMSYNSDALVNILMPLIQLCDYSRIEDRGYLDERDQYLWVYDEPDGESIIHDVVTNFIEFLDQFGYTVNSQYKCITVTTSTGHAYVIGYDFADNAIYKTINVYDSQMEPITNVIMDGPSHVPHFALYWEASYDTNAKDLLVDVINDLQNNSLILDCFGASIDLNVDTMTDRYDVSNALEGVQSDAEEVKDVKAQLISLASTGGILGVLSYIKNIFNAATNAQVSTDGFIEYSSNDQYMTKSFLAGCITSVASSVANIITLIGYVCAPVLAVIGFIGSSLCSLASAVMNITKNTSPVASPEPSSIPCFAVSGSHHQDTFNSSNEVIVNQLLTNRTPLLVHSYGQWFILSSSGSTIRAQSFIDVADRTLLASGAGSELFTRTTITGGYKYSITPSKSAEIIKEAGVYNTVPLLNDNIADNCISADNGATLKIIVALNYVLALLGTSSIMDNTGQQCYVEVMTSGVATKLYNHSLSDSGWNLDLSNYIIANVIGSVFLWLDGILSDSDFDSAISWKNLCDVIDVLDKNVLSFNTDVYFNNKLKYIDVLMSNADYIQPLDTKFSPGLIPPNYEPNTIGVELAIIGATSAVLIATTAICAYNVRKKINYNKAYRQAKVEKAYDDFWHNPTEANYNAYRSAVKKNNLFANVFGGTKYSKINRWDTTETSEGISSRILSLSNKQANQEISEFAAIKKLITG